MPVLSNENRVHDFAPFVNCINFKCIIYTLRLHKVLIFNIYITDSKYFNMVIRLCAINSTNFNLWNIGFQIKSLLFYGSFTNDTCAVVKRKIGWN